MALTSSIEWRISDQRIGYPEAVAEMEARVAAIRRGETRECVWLLEHPPLYTAGTSADPAELVDAARFPVHPSGRGGRYTYHGPGQRVAYVMLNLAARGGDVHAYVRNLEEWVIRALDVFGVRAERRTGRVGLWVALGGGREDKIAAIGVRVRHGITFHGVAINVDPELEHFSGIVPCGIREHGVTSLWALGHTPTLAEVDAALIGAWEGVFG